MVQLSARKSTAAFWLLAAVCLGSHVAVQAQYVSDGWRPGQSADRSKDSASDGAGWAPEGFRPAGYKPTAAPVKRNESSMESLVRYGLTKFLKWSDEEVDASRSQVISKIQPTFHPRIEIISESSDEDIDQILGFGPRGIDQDQSVFATDDTQSFEHSTGSGRSAPWAILISASKADKESQNMDAVWNRTLHALYPDASLRLAQVIIDEEEAARMNSAAADGGEFEVVGGFTVPKSANQAAPTGAAAAMGGVFGQLASGLFSPEEITRKASAAVEGIEYLTPAQAEAREQLAASIRPALENWRFAYVDFYTDARLTWKWSVWKVPVLVIATPSTSKQRTYDLRFLKAAFVKPDPDQLLRLLGRPSEWQSLPVWSSSFAPGGRSHGIVLIFANFFQRFIYPVFDTVPTWLLTIIIAGAASALPGLLHSDDDKTLKAAHEAKKRRHAAEVAVKQSMQRKDASPAAAESPAARTRNKTSAGRGRGKR